MGIGSASGTINLKEFNDLRGTTQYLWFASAAGDPAGTGVHITYGSERDFRTAASAWTTDATAGGKNILINNDNGFIIRDGKLNLMTLTDSALTFNKVVNNTTIPIATFSDVVTLGQSTNAQSYLNLDYHSLIMKDKEGYEYMHVSDLRGSDGVAYNVIDTFIGDGTKNIFELSMGATNDTYSVTWTGSAPAIQSKTTSRVTFSSSVPLGTVIKVTYDTTNRAAKCYTVGVRHSDDEPSPMSFEEGYNNKSSAFCAHAEGYYTTASGRMAHAEGNQTQATAEMSHAEGFGTAATKPYAHAEGNSTTAQGFSTHAEGHNTSAGCYASHAEGYGTHAHSSWCHAEGYLTHAGRANSDTQNASHAEGRGTHAEGSYSHAEGYSCYATGYASHAEGNSTEATMNSAHSEGYDTHALGNYSHAEGAGNTANGAGAHVEGSNNTATGQGCHVGGYDCQGTGVTFVHGQGLRASSTLSCVIGSYNKDDTSGDETSAGDYLFIIGNGTGNSTSNRSNALTVDWDGNVWAKGNIIPKNRTNDSTYLMKNYIGSTVSCSADITSQISTIHTSAFETITGAADTSSTYYQGAKYRTVGPGTYIVTGLVRFSSVVSGKRYGVGLRYSTDSGSSYTTYDLVKDIRFANGTTTIAIPICATIPITTETRFALGYLNGGNFTFDGVWLRITRIS